MPFQNKVALVTGSGSGIGEATAKRLSREGATIVVADVDPQGGERVVKDINAEGGRAAFVQTDVSDEQQTEAMVQFAVDTFGGLHLAVNNAGFGEAPSPMHQLEPSVFDRVIAVDLKGVWLCMRAELAHFVNNGGGAIVNTASGAGLKAVPGLTAYTAAKHGVVGLTRTGAIDYIKQDIRINAVAPGAVTTPLLLSQAKEQIAAISALMPTGRVARPEEIAAGIVWLLSDEASYVTGTILEIDGGFMQA